MNMPNEINLAASSADDQDNKYLQFELDEELYGIEIGKVREINGLMDITAVPKTPVFMKGLINLRGKVIPVIDLRLKFGLAEYKYSQKTSIIVIEFKSIHGQVQMGIIVDTVSEVITLGGQNIEPPPEFGARFRSEYIKGVVKIRNRVVIILDIDLILTDEDLTFGA
jgi:purine-binding chemotaxis protein CheW